MIVAFLSDIHGNAAALRAVISDLPTVDRVVCCGDIVGYYPDPSESIAIVRALGAATVRGNHELMVCGLRTVPDERAASYKAQWTHDVLTADEIEWLKGLPVSLERSWDGLTVTARHASPWDEDTYLYPDSPALDRISLGEGEWIVLGHTHYPMQVRRGLGWVVNPGSIGQPRDWDPRASYALLDTATGTWTTRRVEYDHSTFQVQLEMLGWERQTIHVLGRRRQSPVAV